MKWFKKGRNDPCIDEAKRAVEQAQERRVQVTSEWPEVWAAGAGLRHEMKKNHLTDLFVRSLGGQP